MIGRSLHRLSSKRATLPVALFVLLVGIAPLLHAAQVTLLHISDYHSHAIPFYSEGRANQGGLARAIGYLKQEKARGALVFSGGDTINRGSPLWSDEYKCLDWPWFNGIIDATAFGNHDSDYGGQTFEACRSQITYPILSANIVDAEGRALFPAYRVFEKNGVRVGVFALAGSDFTALVRPEHRPAAGAQFIDATEAARKAVRDLREKERADIVVLIGHQYFRDDFALAQAVPGIDIIFGSHSHLKRELMKIPGTNTWFICPYQYLTYVSRVVVTVEGHRLTKIRGTLERIDETRPIDRTIAERVAHFQRRMTTDPKNAALFKPIGSAMEALDIDDHASTDAALPNLVMDIMRERSSADVAVSTASSFRQALPKGAVTENDLRDAMPYDNKVVMVSMNGAALQRLLERSAALRETDDFLQISGVRMTIEGSVVRVTKDGSALDPARTYRVATTDYLARIATSYREELKGLEVAETPIRIRQAVLEHFRQKSPVKGERDGRIKGRLR